MKIGASLIFTLVHIDHALLSLTASQEKGGFKLLLFLLSIMANDYRPATINGV